MTSSNSDIKSHRLTSLTAVCSVAAALVLTTACADMSERQQGTAKGAGIGALAGAVLSSATGGNAGTGAVIGGALGAVGGNLWSKRMEDRRTAMQQATRGTGVEVSRTADNRLKINVPSDVSFSVNSASIKPELRSVLDPFANSLQNDPNARIEIIGHTDSTGSDALNNPLSEDRARSVRDYLAARGVASNRIQTAGRGEREPLADNNSESGRARNRRVEIFLRDPA